jgi:hypothetical protein
MVLSVNQTAKMGSDTIDWSFLDEQGPSAGEFPDLSKTFTRRYWMNQRQELEAKLAQECPMQELSWSVGTGNKRRCFVMCLLLGEKLGKVQLTHSPSADRLTSGIASARITEDTWWNTMWDPTLSMCYTGFKKTGSANCFESVTKPVVSVRQCWQKQMKVWKPFLHLGEAIWKKCSRPLKEKAKCFLMFLLLSGDKVALELSPSGFAGHVGGFRVPAAHVPWWDSSLFPSLRSMNKQTKEYLRMKWTLRMLGFKETFEATSGDLVYTFFCRG